MQGANSRTIGFDVSIGAARHPRKVAVAMVGGRQQTYAEMEKETNRIANALLGAGLQIGSRVGIWLENSIDYVNIYVACLKAGLVIVQVNSRHTVPEADYQLANSGAVALVFDDSVAERVEQLNISAELQLLLATGNQRVRNAQGFRGFVRQGSPLPVMNISHESDIAVIGYTSGTSGFPKGVELTYASIRNIGYTNALSSRYALESRQVFGLSLSFTATVPAHILPHLYVGGTTFLMKSWDTEQLIHAIVDESATFTILPSPVIREFIRVARELGSNLPSITSVLHSASKAPAEHLREFVDYFGTRLVEGWGMTENSGGLVTATTAKDFEHRDSDVFASAGRAVPGALVKLVDEGGMPIEPDGKTIGQLKVSTPSLARGYWQNEQATRSSFRDQWYFTGDLGTISEDGMVTIVDRRTDLIISGGMNVYPSEIERVIAELPDVREACVVAKPHARWGQTPVAFISVREGSKLAAEAVLQYCEGRLASYKLPSKFHILDSLPVNTSGKIQREVLRSLAKQLGE